MQSVGLVCFPYRTDL